MSLKVHYVNIFVLKPFSIQINSWQQLAVALVTCCPPVCLMYEFNTWSIITYCTFKAAYNYSTVCYKLSLNVSLLLINANQGGYKCHVENSFVCITVHHCPLCCKIST